MSGDLGCPYHPARVEVRSEGGPIPSRYDDIDLTATARMKTAARRGKQLRQKHRRGGTRKGREMANRIIAGQRIHPDNVRDMFAFFERFSKEAERQRGTERWDVSSDRVGPLRIAWDLWGGDAGRAWARGKRRQLEAADREERCFAWETVGLVLRAVDLRADLPRPAYWRAWLDRVQRPTERQIRAQWRRGRAGIFPDQAKRYADRVGEVLGGRRSIRRNVSDDELRAILMNDAELAIVRDQFDPETIERGVRRAYGVAARRLMDSLAFDPTLDPTDQIIAEMITNVQRTTKDRVAKVVRAGLAEGASIGDLQRAIMRDTAFSPARALTVARTETARTVSEGQEIAFDQAADLGVVFLREWVDSQDDAVRATHRPEPEGLGGQTRRPGELFTSPSGAQALGPGMFMVAAEDINCRCVVRPVDIRG